MDRTRWLAGPVRGLEPQALRDVEELGEGWWQVRGPRPLLGLVPRAGAPIPTGDVRLEVDLSEASAPVNATLIVNMGHGFTEAALRLPLPALRAGRVTAVVTLPRSTVGIGLDPGPLGKFRLVGLKAVELSAVGAVVAHAAPQVARLLRNPRQLVALLGRAVRLLRYRGPSGVVERLRRGTQRQLAEEGYDGWARRYATLTDEQRTHLVARLGSLVVRPRFSVLLAPGHCSAEQVERTLDSLRRQIYPSWELCLAEDGATNDVRQLASQVAGAGHLRWAKGADALAAAQGDLVVRLEPGDVLAEQALFAVAELAGEQPTLALLYSDTDGVDAAGRLSPAFKPDWSPELLHSLDYVGRSAFLRTARARAVGAWGREPGGAAHHALLLRYTAGLPAKHIAHLPFVLLRTRQEQAPTAEEAQARVAAVQADLDGAHLSARVEPGPRPRTCRVRYAVSAPPPQVSVLVPTRDRVPLLRRCLESVQRVAYTPVEVLVVDNASRERRTQAYFRQLEEEGAARVLAYPQPFNYSAMNNLAAREARGEVLCLLNNDVEAIDPGWLTEMVGLAQQPGVGAVGAKLLYPNNTVQHAGTVAGLFGVAAHGYLREPRDADGYLLALQTGREVAAVTAACMVIRKDRFLEVGGLDENDLPVAFNDVDLCFKLLKAGYRNLWTPYAELYHRESASRGTDERGRDRRRFLREEAVMRQRWSALIEHDPYYNPNLSLDSNVPQPAWPPRVVWPWERAP